MLKTSSTTTALGTVYGGRSLSQVGGLRAAARAGERDRHHLAAAWSVQRVSCFGVLSVFHSANGKSYILVI